MDLRRIRALMRVHCFGIARGSAILLTLFFLGIVVMTLGLRWDGTHVRVFGVVQDGFGESPDRETALTRLLTEFYAWAWLIVGLSYVLPAVLLPLANGFSLTHTLWLRLLPCHPREVAIARAARVMTAVGMTTGLSLMWVSACVVYHSVSIAPLLTSIFGWVAHVVMAGGIVLIAGPWLDTATSRAAAAFAAFLAPLVCFLGYLAFAHRLGEGWQDWVPYTAPFTHNFAGVLKHYVSTAAVGGALLIWSCVGVRGRIVRPTSVY